MKQVYTAGKALAVTPVEIKSGDISELKTGDVVAVRGITKGKGFAGVVKRHGFKGKRASHGTKHHQRSPGSIGGGGRAGGNVVKGMKMAGRMGGVRVTIKNLRLIDIAADKKVLIVSGAVPGAIGTIVEIRSPAKKA